MTDERLAAIAKGTRAACEVIRTNTEDLLTERESLRTRVVALEADREKAIIWAVEWALKHAMTREQCPLSWDAGFPGYKAQALLDYSALAPEQP